MTIEELILALSIYPKDYKVIISGDSEGNSFLPADSSFQKANYSSDGNIYLDSDEVDGYKENAIIIFPQ